MADLLPCPFCGSSAVGLQEAGHFYVSCNACFCVVGEAFEENMLPAHIFASEEDAAQAWNKRANDK
jgi:hypothetical protein